MTVSTGAPSIPQHPMTQTRRNVLFLCTGNSARSILAEAILRRDGADRFAAFSAGSQPRGEVHPFARELLDSLAIPLAGLYSKSWDVFTGKDAPAMDIVITVCDGAANETCPIWPGAPVRAHWGMPDPAAATGSPNDRRRAFADAFRQLESRIAALIGLTADVLEAQNLGDRLSAIGRSR